MGTIVTIEVVATDDFEGMFDYAHAIGRAFGWFQRVEECCTRFDPCSEAMQLVSQVDVPVPVSAILFEAVQFAVTVAQETDGAFDPTVGFAMESRGFNRHYRTGQIVRSGVVPGEPVSYRDVRVDPIRKTITLLRPLVLDLGAIAKGLAIDLAARELEPFENVAIDAGGDLYLRGCNPRNEPWSVGIRHPRRDNQLIDAVRVSNRAVCTSGGYERVSALACGGHHIVDPRTGISPKKAASVTVVAPTAMLADALSTAAFVLGPSEGTQFLERMGVDGLIFSSTLERYETRGLAF